MINDSNAQSKAQVSANEILKANDPTLAGSIAATLADPEADRFSDDDNQFLKFHGIYQQDDRDLRKTGKKYIMMIRGRIPAGVLSSAQYRVYDELSERHGNQTLRITTRQSLQFHGVVKRQLGPLMKSLNEALLTTQAACGDVARNVMAPCTPPRTDLERRIQQDAVAISHALTPSTPAYHAIWLDGVQLDLGAPEQKGFTDPLYGRTYLPRKFKIGFALPPVNDVDIFTQCLGFIAIADDQGNLAGYNLTVGGGMGRSHNNDATFPRLGDVAGFLPPDRVVEASRVVVTIHRDFGDRADRKHARLKYVIADRGIEWFREEFTRRAGFALEPARPFAFEHERPPYGWHEQGDGRWFLGLFIENGRIKDEGDWRLKSALREIATRFDIEFRLTPVETLLLANIADGDKAAIERILAEHGILGPEQFSPVRRASMACVALPTCGLALAESERYLPDLLTRVESLLEEVGLKDEEITVRMTGCPNGCARPYAAEIGFVGKGPGRYQLWLGGNATGTRLNRVYKEMVKDPEIIGELSSLLQRFVGERQNGERFGDWVARVLWPEAAVN
ncbi:MAG: NADPH-dependent assimilatory sulfite reductase hemoprotein subunit [Verrucomicrobiae bacterium]|nr:NADPH-dependent assimilatory sulfite reductase hemoprotein subunit [Verrucomicrobiae bacterium]